MATFAERFRGLPIHWDGVDSTTPDRCTLVVTTVVGLITCYVLRDGEIIGRTEIHDDNRFHGYIGTGLKGGYYVGTGYATELQARIAKEAN